MKYPLNPAIYMLGLSLFFFSCTKMVQVDSPKNQIVTSQVFVDSINAAAAVSGIYAQLAYVSTGIYFGNGAITIYTGLSSDELYPTSLNSTDDLEFYTNSLSKDNSKNASFWSQAPGAYGMIYQTNACIEGLNKSLGINASIRNQLVSECKVIRSFLYFNLVNLYGDIPFIVSTDYNVNKTLPRTSREIIYQNLISDLLEAQNQLLGNYFSAGRVRINKYAAMALLSRIYLYQKQWSQAEDAASQIINSNIYALDSNLSNVFLAISKEAIWQLRPVQSGYETAEGQKLIPSTAATALPGYGVSDYLINAFELSDTRKTNWIAKKIVNNQTYSYPFKYKLRFDGAASPLEHYMIFRLAEQFLIRAEARAQQNKLPEAIADLNLIRKRAGLLGTVASSQPQIIQAILHERQTELFCEWGHRWYDLKRTNTIDGILSAEKSPNWQSTDALYPIPNQELQLNPFLTQNPGY